MKRDDVRRQSYLTRGRMAAVLGCKLPHCHIKKVVVPYEVTKPKVYRLVRLILLFNIITLKQGGRHIMRIAVAGSGSGSPTCHLSSTIMLHAC